MIPRMGTLAIALTIAGVARSAPPSEKVPAERAIGELVKNLGDDSYFVRESATADLAKIGTTARDHLVKAQQSADAEVRYRSTRLLAVIDENDFRDRLAAFAADTNGTRQVDLPGWNDFRARLGSEPGARKLFIEMVTAEREIFEAFQRSPEAGLRALTLRCQGLKQDLRDRGIRKPYTPMATVGSLLLVASDPRIAVDDTLGNQIVTTIRNSLTRVDSGSLSPHMRKLLNDWVGNTDGITTGVAYQNTLLAMQQNLTYGLRPAVMLLRDPKAPRHHRLYGVMAIGKLGDPRHVPLLEPYLKDTTNVGSQRIRKELRQVQMRDVVLAAMVHLIGQDPKDFGYYQIRPHSQYLFSPRHLAFASDRARRAAMAKWRKEYLRFRAKP